jgi:hypothetical protein
MPTISAAIQTPRPSRVLSVLACEWTVLPPEGALQAECRAQCVELCTNAWDASPDHRFDIHLPSLIDPRVIDRDWALGRRRLIANSQDMQIWKPNLGKSSVSRQLTGH